YGGFRHGGETVGDLQPVVVGRSPDAAGEDVKGLRTQPGRGEPCLHVGAAESAPAVVQPCAEPALVVIEEVVEDQKTSGPEAPGEPGNHAGGILDMVENLNDRDDIGFPLGDGG